MTNARGSKSARNAKPLTPADGGKPEVTIETGTTAVLPNPTDAPPPPKRPGRSKKAAPTVATKAVPGATAVEVPEWAKRAAARDTAAEMAAVPEAAPVAQPSPEAPTPRKGRAPKPPKAKPVPVADGAAAPDSLRAIGAAWIESIRSAGHSVSTVSSYGNDLEVAYEYLDGSAPAAGITEKQIAAFNISKRVMKKANGKPKAQPTILKVRRALRLALTWAAQKKLIAKAPYAAKQPA